MTFPNLTLPKPLLGFIHHLYMHRLEAGSTHPPPPLIDPFVPLHPWWTLAAHNVFDLICEIELLHLSSSSVIPRKHCVQRVKNSRIVVQSFHEPP